MGTDRTVKAEYPSIHMHSEITITDNRQGIATGLVYQKKTEVKADQKAGIYFLRIRIYRKTRFTW
jgi:hypothetical protein